MEKKFCTVHRFFYTGDKCPYCEKERYQKLAKKYYKEETVSTNNTVESVEVTDDMLNCLKVKFGC